MSGKPAYLEDFHVGRKFASSRSETVTEQAIIDFARSFDPQPLHTDPEAAKDSMFGGLIASGLFTASLTMRFNVESLPAVAGGIIGKSMSLRWPRPVRPGDTLSYEAEVTAVHVAEGNPTHGDVHMRGVMYNQHRKAVQVMESVIYVPLRPLLPAP